MSKGPANSQNIPGWAVVLLSIAAAICLIESLWLAFVDKVTAGTLTAGLFVVCVLFIYLPRMESFKAWGIEAKWREVKEKEEVVRRAEATLARATKELDDQILAKAPNEELAATFGKVRTAITELSTANNEFSATLTTIAPFRATRGSN
jgi:hypothetical protein